MEGRTILSIIDGGLRIRIKNTVPGRKSAPRLWCPSCGYSLTEKEQRVGACNECGQVFDLGKLLSRQEDQSKKEATDRKAIFAKRLTAVTGAAMILTGLVLISFSKVGIGQLLSGWGAGTSILTIVAVIRQRVYEEPVYPVLLVFGGVWLFFGLLCWGVL